MDRRAENHASGSHGASRRKPLVLIISAAIASVAVAGFIAASAAMLQYKPIQQHVEVEITPRGP
jgi:putative exporter of polyketide antibiotics